MQQHEGCPAARKVADVQAAAIALNSMFGEGREVRLWESVMILLLLRVGAILWAYRAPRWWRCLCQAESQYSNHCLGAAFFSGV